MTQLKYPAHVESHPAPLARSRLPREPRLLAAGLNTSVFYPIMIRCPTGLIRRQYSHSISQLSRSRPHLLCPPYTTPPTEHVPNSSCQLDGVVGVPARAPGAFTANSLESHGSQPPVGCHPLQSERCSPLRRGRCKSPTWFIVFNGTGTNILSFRNLSSPTPSIRVYAPGAMELHISTNFMLHVTEKVLHRKLPPDGTLVALQAGTFPSTNEMQSS